MDFRDYLTLAANRPVAVALGGQPIREVLA